METLRECPYPTCDWETVADEIEAANREAMLHLETEHDLEALWTRGRIDADNAVYDA